MPRKPDNIIYGIDDRPPLVTTLLLALQHLFVLSSTLMLPVILVQAIGGTMAQIEGLVACTLIAAGIGTITQALRWGPLGSGYLLPNLCGPAYLSVSLQAAWMGGLPLLHGMIIVGGFFEALLSRVIHHIRRIFPPEITGLVVLMVGISLIPIGTSKFVGVEYAGDRITPTYLLVSTLTLSAMICCNIWSESKLRPYSVLIGLVIGYGLSWLAGYLTQNSLAIMHHARWFDLPFHHLTAFHLQFKWSLLAPFLIISTIGSLKTFGNLSTAQKINDADWQQPDTKNISKGLLADAISVTMAGLLGGMATDSSSSNVGLSLATGSTSRYLAFFVGALCILLGFSPKAVAIISIMPSPVMGALLVFVTSFMVLSGLHIIVQSKPSTKKIFIVGIAFIFGLSTDLLSDLYTFVPSWLSAIFSSSLTLSTTIAVILNLAFNADHPFSKLRGKFSRSSK